MRAATVFLILIAATSCSKQPPASVQMPPASSTPAVGEYEKKLNATKAGYPFGRWRSRTAFVAIFDRLIADLVEAGEGATEEKKVACFQHAVTALNGLFRTDVSLIETGEAEELIGLGNVVAKAAGLEPKKYGHGEGPLSAGRDW